MLQPGLGGGRIGDLTRTKGFENRGWLLPNRTANIQRAVLGTLKSLNVHGGISGSDLLENILGFQKQFHWVAQKAAVQEMGLFDLVQASANGFQCGLRKHSRA